MFDIKHKKSHLFLINTFQIARKNLPGDAEVTPLHVTARRREKYYTKQVCTKPLPEPVLTYRQ